MHRLLNFLRNIIIYLLSLKRILRISFALLLDVLIIGIIFLNISNFDFSYLFFSILVILILNLYFGIYINNLRRSLLFNNLKLLLSLSMSLIIFYIAHYFDVLYLRFFSFKDIFSSICISYFAFYTWRTLFIFLYDKFHSQSINKKKIILFHTYDDIEFILKIIQEFEIIAICDLNQKKKLNSKFRSIPYIKSDQLKNFSRDDIFYMVNQKDFYKNNNFHFFEGFKNSVIIFEKKPLNNYEILDPNIAFLLNKQFDFKKSDNEAVINNKKILITGAGGTIGGELLRQCLNYNTSKIVLLDHDEFSIYQITNKYSNKKLIPIVGSIANNNQLKEIFKKYSFDYIFHCAAYKHVNLVQDNFHTVFYNNIIGTINLALLLIKYSGTKLIFVSTDKAINPSSTMGASKRICELFLMSLYKKHKSLNNLRIVRFGNVIGSKGSFIPKLIQQIRNNQTITITNNKVERYFMTVDQAVGLILSSTKLTHDSECIYTFRMGNSINIKALAEKIIKYSGYFADINSININFSKLNTGEKLKEILFLDRKNYIETKNNDIYLENQKVPNYKEIQKLINSFAYKNQDNQSLIEKLIKFAKTN